MATLAATNGVAAAVLVVFALTGSGTVIPLLLLAVVPAGISAWLGSSSVTASPESVIVRTGWRSRSIGRAAIKGIGITAVKRTKLSTVGLKLDGGNVGISCLQRLPTDRARRAIANQVFVLLTCRLDGDGSARWSTDAVADDAWQVLEELVLTAHAGQIEQLAALSRATSGLPSRTAGRLAIYVLMSVANLVSERVGPIRDQAVLDRLSAQLEQRYGELFRGHEYGVRDVLGAAVNIPEEAVGDVNALFVQAGTAIIGSLLGDDPHAELGDMRIKLSGSLLVHAADFPANVLVPTRIYSG